MSSVFRPDCDEWRGLGDALAADDDFAEVVAGEKELDGVEVLEQFFEGAVVEGLCGAALSAGPLTPRAPWRRRFHRLAVDVVSEVRPALAG